MIGIAKGKRILISFFVAGAVAMAGADAKENTTTAAKSQAASAPTAGAAEIDPNIVRDVGLNIVRSIDSNQAGHLWDGGSIMIKRAVQREVFVMNVAKARKGYGKQPLVRHWTAIHRQSGGGAMPVGQYVSVQFSAEFSDKRVLREVISLRRDEDGVWRFVGYAIN